MTLATKAPANRLRVVLVAVVLLAGAARLAYLLSPVMQFNADEAVTGIMVRDILHGHGYVFYAGQQYGGTLEQWIEAAAYAALRLPQNPLTLRLPLVGLCMITCGLVYRVGRDVLDDPARAVVAAAFYAVGPWFNVIGPVTSLGFYAAGQTLTIAALWCALRAERGRRWLAGLGLVAGLGVWTAVTALYVLVPVFVWLLPTLGTNAKRWLALAGGFVLGALPQLAALIAHRTLPVPQHPAESSTVLQRLGNLFGPILRQYAGVTYSHSNGGLWLPVQILVVAVLVLAYLVALVRRRGLADFLRPEARRPGDLLLAVPPVVVVLWAASNATWYTGTPRYLAGTYPLLAIGLAALLPRLRVAVTFLIGSALLAYAFFPTIQLRDTRARDAALGRVTSTLAAEGHTDVWAGYWTAMPLQYVARDRLTVAIVGGVPRFPAAQAAVARATDAVWVGSGQDASTASFRAALDRARVPYRARTVGDFTIFDELPPGTAPGKL